MLVFLFCTHCRSIFYDSSILQAQVNDHVDEPIIFELKLVDLKGWEHKDDTCQIYNLYIYKIIANDQDAFSHKCDKMNHLSMSFHEDEPFLIDDLFHKLH